MPARLLASLIAVGVVIVTMGVRTESRAYEPSINYALQCMGCHTPDGSGVADRVPNIKETLVPFSTSGDGRRFLVQVPGSAQSTLNNAELAELLNWMIQTLSTTKPSASFVPFTEEEVTKYRSQTLVEVRATRERLLREALGVQHE